MLITKKLIKISFKKNEMQTPISTYTIS